MMWIKLCTLSQFPAGDSATQQICSLDQKPILQRILRINQVSADTGKICASCYFWNNSCILTYLYDISNPTGEPRAHEGLIHDAVPDAEFSRPVQLASFALVPVPHGERSAW